MGRSLLSTLLPLLSALTVLSGPTSVFGSTFECIQLDIKVHLGQDAPDSEVSGLELYDPTSHYSFLGKGEMGGTVYRVRPSDSKPSYVLKQYFDTEMRRKDELGFAKLLQLLPPMEGIEIVRPEVVGKLSMKLPDINGETLEKAVNDPRLSDSQRIELTSRWNRFIKRVDSAVRGDPHSRGPTYMTFSPLHRFLASFTENDQKFPILLKPDNVVVDPKTGRMFVIDPF